MKRELLAFIVGLAPIAYPMIIPVVADAEERSPVPLPETVITATRIATEIEKVGRTVDVRTQDDFQAQKTFSVSDQLQTVPGLRTAEIGGPGAPGVTPFEIRGFRTSGTQFLINGLRFNDPSSIAGTADSIASFMTTNDLSSVEVLKGASSVLYGSDGQAGAINFITARPKEGFSTDLSIQGGSFGTIQEYANINLGTESGGVFASVSRIDSDGIDANGEYENTTAFINGEVKLSETFSLQPIVRMVSAQNDLDRGPRLNESQDGWLPSSDSPTDTSKVNHVFYGAIAEYSNQSDFRSRLSTYVNDADRAFFFDFGFGGSPFDYRGRSFNVDWQNSLTIDELGAELVAGFDYENQSARSVATTLRDSGVQDRYGLFAKYRQFLLDEALTLDGGVRATHVSSISNTLPSLEFSAAYNLAELGTKFHSSVAQGFRAPTVYETDGLAEDFNNGTVVNVGNRSLKEEETLTFDVGVTQALPGGVSLDLTYFSLESDQTILFDFENLTHVNGDGARTRGVESGLSASPFDWLLVRGAYTYLAKAEGLDGARTQRRPFNIWALNGTAKFDRFTAFSEVRYRGGQNLAFFGTSDLLRESSVILWDATVSYDLTKETQLFVRADNLLDREFTEGGYRMPGSSVMGGIRFRL